MATIIVDIDGTLLSNGSNPIKRTIEYVNEQAKSNRIVIVTGRPSSDRARTVSALRQAGVKYNALKMAPNSANTHSLRIEFKRKTGAALQAAENVVMAIDNDADARAAYAKSGIATKNPSHLPSVVKWDGMIVGFIKSL